MKKQVFRCYKNDNEPFQIESKEIVQTMLNGLKRGRYTLTLEEEKEKGSHDQFKWLYGSIYPQSLLALIEAGYEFTPEKNESVIEMVDVFWKEMFAERILTNRKTGDTTKIPRDKRNYSTLELMLYCDKIRDYCAEYLGAYIPEPDKDWKKKLKEERDKSSSET